MRLKSFWCFLGLFFCLLLAGEPGKARAEEETVSGENGPSAAAAQVLRLSADAQAAGGLAAADLTGNGLVDGADAQALLLHGAGLLNDTTALAGILSDSLLGEKYLEKFSKIEVRVPIERKELYKTAAGDKSMCAYVIGLIEEDIKRRNIQ